MSRTLVVLLASVIAAASCREAPKSSGLADNAPVGRGTIRGHVRLTGTPPENLPIRLRADPMCEKVSGGKPTFQETVVAGQDGSLANVFVQLKGTFPETAPPTQPVTIDQRGCIYSPRMVGVQLGQPLHIVNSDPGLHNVHGVSTGSDGFNVGQPLAGMVHEVRLEDEGILRLQCDVHTWMVAFVGVVSHPYFAVTGPAGTFELRDVPVGTYTIQAWHELYGPLTLSVQVVAGGVANVDFTYTGEQKRTARILFHLRNPV
jgi:plastocyanin